MMLSFSADDPRHSALLPTVRLPDNMRQQSRQVSIPCLVGVGGRCIFVTEVGDVRSLNVTGYQVDVSADGKANLEYDVDATFRWVVLIPWHTLWPKAVTIPSGKLAVDVAEQRDGEGMIKLDAIDSNFTDLMEKWYGNFSRTFGQSAVSANGGVKVAVIDTGCGPHPALNLLGRAEGVPVDNDEDPFGHGTRVAGIIGATARGPQQTCGIVPKVSIVPFRIGKVQCGNFKVSSFSTASAIESAVKCGCSLRMLLVDATMESLTWCAKRREPRRPSKAPACLCASALPCEKTACKRASLSRRSVLRRVSVACAFSRLLLSFFGKEIGERRGKCATKGENETN